MNEKTGYITSWVVVRNQKAFHDGKPFFETTGADRNEFIKELYKKLGPEYPKFYKMDNLCKLAFVSTELLLKNRSLDTRYDAKEIALVFSNASSSLDTDKNYYAALEDKSNYFPSPAVFVYTLPNIMMGEICIRYRLTGENIFFISQDFDARLLSDYSEDLLASGKAKCIICGWVEISGDKSEAALFLVEKEPVNPGSKSLTADHINNIYSIV